MTDFFKGHRTSFLAGLAALVIAAASAVAFLAGSSGEGAPPARVQVPVDRPAGLPTVLVRTQPHTAAPVVRPDLLSRAGTSAVDQAEPEYVPGQLLVKFQEDATPTAAAAALERVDGEVDESVRRLEVSVVDVPDGQAARALAELEASPAVAYAERDVALAKFDTIPNDSLWRDQWGPALVHAPRAWDSGTGSGSTVVAVLDTGVDRTHPDLQGALVGGYDVVHGDADPLDEDGHGTSSAGVIGARTNNTTGQAGVCWGCSLMPVQVLDENGSGTTSDVATGIVWAADHGARVISMSLGGEGTTQTLTDAVAYAASKGVVLVAAAGNSGSSTPTYPAAYSQVIGVAGSTPEDTLYSWSNYGSWVRVAAPGCNVATARGGGYVNFCGTSSAAPVVAGLVGLALSYKPVASAAAIEAAITGSGAHFDGVQSGRIDAAGTLVALGAPSAGSGSSRPAPAVAAPAAASPSPRATAPPAAAAPPAAEDDPDAEPPVATPARTLLHGRLTSRTPRQRFSRALGAGILIAELRSSSRRPLTLEVVDTDLGKTVARASGASPLRLSRKLRDGNYAFVVSARSSPGRFTLGLSTTRAPGR